MQKSYFKKYREFWNCAPLEKGALVGVLVNSQGHVFLVVLLKNMPCFMLSRAVFRSGIEDKNGTSIKSTSFENLKRQGKGLGLTLGRLDICWKVLGGSTIYFEG